LHTKLVFCTFTHSYLTWIVKHSFFDIFSKFF
jgi:hypothetical protein